MEVSAAAACGAGDRVDSALSRAHARFRAAPDPSVGVRPDHAVHQCEHDQLGSRLELRRGKREWQAPLAGLRTECGGGPLELVFAHVDQVAERTSSVAHAR
jgi:hypothetical protein